MGRFGFHPRIYGHSGAYSGLSQIRSACIYVNVDVDPGANGEVQGGSGANSMDAVVV